MFVKVTDILPKESYTGDAVIVRLKGDLAEIFYETKYQNGKLKTAKFQPSKALIPLKIELTRNLVEALGLYFGDGQTALTTKSYQAVRFANYDPDVIENFLFAMDELKVARRNLKVGLNISKSIMPIDVQSFRTQIVEHWAELTKVPAKNFYKINWLNHTNTKAQFGNITLIYSNSSFRLVFDSIYNHVKSLATKDKTLAAQFLRGIIAADGCVYYDGRHREILIAAKEAPARDFIRKLLTLLGITPGKDGLSKGKEMVRVTGYANMGLARKYNICGIHSEKRDKFNRLYSTYRAVRKMKPQIVKRCTVN